MSVFIILQEKKGADNKGESNTEAERADDARKNHTEKSEGKIGDTDRTNKVAEEIKKKLNTFEDKFRKDRDTYASELAIKRRKEDTEIRDVDGRIVKDSDEAKREAGKNLNEVEAKVEGVQQDLEAEKNREKKELQEIQEAKEIAAEKVTELNAIRELKDRNEKRLRSDIEELKKAKEGTERDKTAHAEESLREEKERIEREKADDLKKLRGEIERVEQDKSKSVEEELKMAREENMRIANDLQEKTEKLKNAKENETVTKDLTESEKEDKRVKIAHHKAQQELEKVEKDTEIEAEGPKNFSEEQEQEEAEEAQKSKIDKKVKDKEAKMLREEKTKSEMDSEMKNEELYKLRKKNEKKDKQIERLKRELELLINTEKLTAEHPEPKKSEFANEREAIIEEINKLAKLLGVSSSASDQTQDLAEKLEKLRNVRKESVCFGTQSHQMKKSVSALSPSPSVPSHSLLSSSLSSRRHKERKESDHTARERLVVSETASGRRRRSYMSGNKEERLASLSGTTSPAIPHKAKSDPSAKETDREATRSRLLTFTVPVLKEESAKSEESAEDEEVARKFEEKFGAVDKEEGAAYGIYITEMDNQAIGESERGEKKRRRRFSLRDLSPKSRIKDREEPEKEKLDDSEAGERRRRRRSFLDWSRDDRDKDSKLDESEGEKQKKRRSLLFFGGNDKSEKVESPIKADELFGLEVSASGTKKRRNSLLARLVPNLLIFPTYGVSGSFSNSNYRLASNKHYKHSVNKKTKPQRIQQQFC